MEMRDRESAAELAARHKLRRKRPNEWRGKCPVCGYADSFVLTNKVETPLFWCANGCDRPALIAAVFGDATGSATSRLTAQFTRDRSGLAKKLWGAAKPAAGSPVESYLASRALSLPSGGALRFELEALHPSKTKLPAMRAAVRDAAGQVVAIHSTYLRADGLGKASVEPPRTTLGSTRGGAVRLHPAGESLIIGEGIETSLAAAELLRLPAWAALNAGNLGDAIVPPRDVREVVIAADRDEPGQRAAHLAVRRLRGLGFSVRVAVPTVAGDDFNDILKRQRGLSA